MTRPAAIMPVAMTALAVGLLSLMDAFMKDASLAAGAYSASIIRCAIGTALVAPVWLAQGSRWPDRAALLVHMIRGTVSAFMMTTFFFALTRLRLAEAIAISFIAPIVALYLARVVLGEEVGKRAWIGAALGLVGTLVIVGGRLANERMDAANWIGLGSLLLSAMLYALNLVLQRKQALLAKPVEIATFQNAVVTLVLGLAAPFWLVIPGSAALVSIGAAAVLSTGSLIMLGWAYARAQAQVLVPLEYSGFLWAGLFGWLFFGEAVTWPMVTGAAIIVAGCWIAVSRKALPPHTEQVTV